MVYGTPDTVSGQGKNYVGQEEKNAALNLQRFKCPYPQCGKTWPRRSDEVPAKCAKCQRRLRGRFRLDQILAERHSPPSAPELQVKSEQSKSPTPFPRDSPSGNLKNAQQLALYRELVEKLVRIIASGNAEALIILKGAVKTALNELPPDPPVEASPSERVPKLMPPTRARGGKSA